MAGKKTSSLDRVLGRLDTLDSVNLANLVQRLARERGLFEDIFNTLQEGVLVMGADGRIEYANAAAQRMVGLGDENLAGETLWRIVPGLRSSLEIALPFILGLMRLEIQPLPADPVLLVHLALVALLLIVFPISKLMHAPGLFFSPTRNQSDTPREARHVAAWAAAQGK